MNSVHGQKRSEEVGYIILDLTHVDGWHDLELLSFHSRSNGSYSSSVAHEYEFGCGRCSWKYADYAFPSAVVAGCASITLSPGQCYQPLRAQVARLDLALSTCSTSFVLGPTAIV